MKIDKIVKELNKMFPDAGCELNHQSKFELLVSVILSAQCTDKRVNQVTESLFKIANTPEDFVNMPQEELEGYIKSCGFYHNKAKNIISMSKDLIKRFGGEVPQNMDDLVSLAGVGNKTANVVVSVAFGGDAFAVDTHVLRVSNRLGLVDTKNPDICMRELKKTFQRKDWSRLHYQMVLFGRYKCKALKPQCEDCPLQQECVYYKSRRVNVSR